ncbi:hypothetical protein Sta7437_3954 [Stanieria cyanosphaera PCC 7437]|uniref:Uncharacterized protein n=1 Tax=Stanieria cyanosphaera (strain ATCC 29371 / PCC 7437) TaxID=111780 RepID=K9XZ87_STAC7|nr:hypothetical protein [Stanieria cyanosphaera]AFZ37436.1 hypothetical protein Sta7437_3954 [Stanieria cyanosphaera PCC 7437]
MAASAEFKQALRAGQLTEAFVIAMSKTPELEITTWIASPNQTQSTSTQPQPGHRLRTQINLVAGEIKNEIGDRFIHNDADQQVHQFHLDQVSRGHQTIKQNLLSLQQMFRLMAVLQNYQQSGEYRELNWSPEAQSPQNVHDQISQSMSIDSNSVQLNSASTINQLEVEEQLNRDRYSTTFISAEEDDDETNLLSLEDLEAEPEDQAIRQSVEEEWGEWLQEEDDDSAMAADILDIDSLELNEAARWDELDNTEFLPNTSARFFDKNKPNSNHP